MTQVGLFLLWSLLLLTLVIIVTSPIPNRIRAVVFGGLIATTWLLWGLYGAEFLSDFVDASKLQSMGQVGDLFGGVNALFAALAFAGVAYASFMQADTNRLAHVQTFENTFFNAIELNNKIVDGLKFDPRIFPESTFDRTLRLAGRSPRTRIVVEGREAFSAVLREIGERAEGDPAEAAAQYLFVQQSNNHVFGHYFRNLYQILKLIDSHVESVISAEDKHRYSSFLRAQLSTNELAVLFLNCLEGVVDRGEFRNLIVRYRMLEHLPLTLVNGIYRTSTGLPLANAEMIDQYLREIPLLMQVAPVSRGAFGKNSVELPT
jgi:hypothetical protein